MPAKFENIEKCDGNKILASLHTIPAQFEIIRKLDGRKKGCNLPKNWMPKKCTSTLRIDRPRPESIENIPFSSFSSIFTMLFSNLPFGVPFSTYAVSTCAVFV